MDFAELPDIIKHVLKKNKNIQAISINESIENKIVMTFYRHSSQMLFNKTIPKEYLKISKEIKKIYYKEEDLATITLYYTTDIEDNNIILTAEEKIWLQNNIVKIGVDEWTPILFLNNYNETDGIVGDYIKLIAKKIDMKYETVSGSWASILEKLKAKEIDLLPNTYYSDERTTYGLFSKPYFNVKDNIYVHSKNKNIKSFKDLSEKKLAIVKGYATVEKVNKKFPNIQVVETENLDDSINKLINNEVDAIYEGQLVVEHIIQEKLITNLKMISQSDIESENIHLFFNSDNVLLKSIMQKTLNSISYNEHKKIKLKWLNNYKEKEILPSLHLTKEELNWINNNVVKIGVEDWAPLIFSKKGNDIGGISGDILKLVLQKTMLQFEIIDNNWDILLSDFKDKKIDILPATYYTDERATYGLYSKPYFKMLDFIYVRENETSILDLKDLENRKLAIIKDYGTIPKIRKKYPSIQIVETENLSDSFNRLLKGEVDALYEGQISSEYKINEDLITGIKGIPQSDFEAANLHFFSKMDEPILQSILQKALNSVSQREINEIKAKWIISNKKVKILDNIESMKENFWLAIGALSIFSMLLIGTLLSGRFFSDEIVAKYFGSKKFSFITTMIVTSMIVLISILVFYTLKLNKQEILDNTKDELGVVLNINIDRLHSWIDDRKSFLLQLGRDPQLITITRELLKYDNDAINLKKSQALKDVRNYFKNKEKEFGKIGFFIISPNMISLGSSRDSNLGTKNFISIQKPELMKKVFEGKSVFIPPIPSDVIIGDSSVKPLTMFFAAPIQDEEGNVLAVLTQRLLPDGKLAKIMHSGRIRKSGESYLIDQFGRILTPSRFKQDLIMRGIINEEDINSNNFFAKNPGVNMSIGEKPKNDKKEWALTKMAEDTISMRIEDKDNILKIQYSDTKYNLEGYRDYRGVPVMGTWYWDHQLDLGMTTELDVSEALKGYHLLRQNLLIITWLTVLLTIISTFMLLLFGEKATRSIQKVNTELNKLLESFDDNVIASRSDLKGSITYASKAFADISGYTVEELMGKPHRMVRHYDMSKELFQSLWKTIQSGNIWKGEVKNKTKDGGFYWVDTVITPEFDENGNLSGFSAIRHDITDKKEVEDLSKNLERKVIDQTKDLRKQKEFVTTLLDSQEQMIITTNGKKLISVNKTFLEFFNISSEIEFQEKYHASCICDTFNIDAPKDYLQIKTNGQQWIDYVIDRPNQMHKVMIILNDIDYIFSVTATNLPNEEGLKSAVFTDITEMENAKKEIEQILANILLPVLITSKKDRKILYANKYAENQYEVPLDKIIGSDIDDIYTIKGQQEHIIDAINKYGFIENSEEEFKTSTDKIFTALLSVTPIKYKNEDCYIGMITDITKQKDMENEVRAIHKHTKDSIEYASLIQSALIPDNNLFRNYFKDYFAIWHPKDIVGGDIYLFEELRQNNDECLLMVIDCTGHGVPGAFVTMLVKAIERSIVSKINHNENEIVSPSEILSVFNKSMKHLLKQEDRTSVSNAGFDGQILYYNKKDKIVKFASARNELFYIQDDEIKIIKGDRHSVGYKDSDANYEFTEHIIDVSKETSMYISSDGYWDQVGGEKERSFGKKRLQAMINEIKKETMAEQKEEFIYTLKDYQGDMDRNDDITVIGLKI